MSRTQDTIRDGEDRVHGTSAGVVTIDGTGPPNGAPAHDYTRHEPDRPEHRTGPLADRIRATGRCPDCGHRLASENHRELCGDQET